MTNNRYYKENLSEDEQELANYYYGCTTCHAYDEKGRLYGKMVLEVEYDGYRNSTRVLSSNIRKVKPDAMDEYEDDWYD